jgi:hypothetical protein
MKYDSGRVALPGTDPAHAVAHVDPIGAARAIHRSMVDRKDHALALCQRHDLGARLHARPLLREHELPAGEVDLRPREQERELQREDMLAVDILMQAVVVARAVLQEERRRLGLSAGVAARQQLRVVMRMNVPDYACCDCRPCGAPRPLAGRGPSGTAENQNSAR